MKPLDIIVLIALAILVAKFIKDAQQIPKVYIDDRDEICCCEREGCEMPSLECCQGLTEHDRVEVIRVTFCAETWLK